MQSTYIRFFSTLANKMHCIILLLTQDKTNKELIEISNNTRTKINIDSATSGKLIKIQGT